MGIGLDRPILLGQQAVADCKAPGLVEAHGLDGGHRASLADLGRDDAEVAQDVLRRRP